MGQTVQSLLDSKGILHCYNVILSDYSDVVLVKPKNLLKYGRSNLNTSGTSFEVMTLPSGVDTESVPSGNAITTVSSANSGDTQAMVVEGHTISGSDRTFVVQSVTLTGQTQASLSTPLHDVTRAYNNGASNFTGPIYIYEDDTSTAGVPDTASKVHLIVEAGLNQSEKGKTWFSSVDYGLITSFGANLSRATGASTICDLKLQVQLSGGVWREVLPQYTLEKGGRNSLEVYCDPPIIVPKNAGVRFLGNASVNNANLSAWFNSYIATVQT